MSVRNIKRLKKYAEKNKRRDVFFEKMYRMALLEKGYFYQRQKVIGNFIVDFVFPKRNLIVEIDESHHAQEDVKSYDIYREKKLVGWGFNVVRFTDFEILNELEDCVNCVDDFEEKTETYRDFKNRLSKINEAKTPKLSKSNIDKLNNFDCKIYGKKNYMSPYLNNKWSKSR